MPDLCRAGGSDLPELVHLNKEQAEEEDDKSENIRTRSDDQGSGHGESQLPAAADQGPIIVLVGFFCFVNSLSVTSGWVQTQKHTDHDSILVCAGLRVLAIPTSLDSLFLLVLRSARQSGTRLVNSLVPGGFVC